MDITNWANLPFEARQIGWDGSIERKFYQHNGRGERPNIWTIRVEEDRIYTAHGLLGGKLQLTNQSGRVKNAGRSNELSSAQDALAEARRMCRKKWDFEGYDEYVNESNIDNRNDGINVQSLLTYLPSSFCLYKPNNSLDNCKKLLDKAESGKPIYYTLKRDGMCYLVVIDYYGNIKFYSRRGRLYHDKEGPRENEDGSLDYNASIEWRSRFEYLVPGIQAMGLPNGTMLAVEMITTPDDFKYVSSITKSYTQEALSKMNNSQRFLQMYVWDIPFFGGVDLVSEQGYSSRYQNIIHHTACLKEYGWGEYILPVQVHHFNTPDLAINYAKNHNLEGWVVVDELALYGDKGWNIKGKPDRPSCVAKLKPKFEDDFIAYWDPDNGLGKYGKGKHEKGKSVVLPNGETVEHNGVGSVALYQYNEQGELVYCADCASGMDYEFQAKLRKEHFPLVVQIEYDSRTYVQDDEKTNALRFPVFLRVRHDKRAEECVNPRL